MAIGKVLSEPDFFLYKISKILKNDAGNKQLAHAQLSKCVAPRFFMVKGGLNLMNQKVGVVKSGLSLDKGENIKSIFVSYSSAFGFYLRILNIENCSS